MKFSTIRKIAGIAMLAGASLMPMARAEIIPQASNTRTRFESTDNSSAMTKTITTALGNKNGEFARVYHNIGTRGDYTTASAIISGFNPYITFVDLEGAGLEFRRNFRETGVDVMAEHAGASQDKTRIGGEIDQRIGKFILGVAYDNVEDRTGTNNVSRDYGLVKVVYDGENNQLGLGFRRTNETEDNSAIVHYMHHGAKEKFGTRKWVKADWNDRTSSSTITFDSINVENPTFSRFSGYWFEENSSIDSGMYNVGVTPNSVTFVERTPIENRTKGGFISDLSGTFTDNSRGQTQCIRTEAGYVFNLPKNTCLGTTVSYSHNFDDKDKNRIGGTIQLGFNALGGRIILEQIANQAVAKNIAPAGAQRVETYSSITYSRQFGVGSKK